MKIYLITKIYTMDGAIKIENKWAYSTRELAEWNVNSLKAGGSKAEFEITEIELYGLENQDVNSQ